MRFTAVLAAALSVVSVSAHYGNYGNTSQPVYTTTEVVSSYETYCAGPTTIVENKHTYTVTAATTLTISNCPCTRTKTYTTVTSTVCSGGCPTHLPSPPVYPNTTAPRTTQVGAYPLPPVQTPSVYPNGTHLPPPSEGAAASNEVTFAGAALAALVGFAAYVL